MGIRNLKLSISRKLTLTYSAILLAILLLFTLLTFFFIRSIIIRDSENILKDNTNTIVNYIMSLHRIDLANLSNINLGQGVYYSVYDGNNNLIFSNMNGQKQFGMRMHGRMDSMRMERFDHYDGNIYADRIVNINNNSYHIQVIKDYEDIGAKTGVLAEILIITSILGTLVSFISGSFLSKRLLRPIQDITKTAREITSKSLNRRIVTNGAKDELMALADTFNLMIERLEADFEKQKRFVSDASHELRTPLAVVHGHVNLLNRWGKNNPEQLDKSLTTLKKETENMNRLIENLLYLAKGDNDALVIKREEFKLAELVKEIVDETAVSCEKAVITSSVDNEIFLNADYYAMKQVFRILVDNSIKYSEDNGEILITAEKYVNNILIKVKDNGTGIPEESVPYIFDRFYRVDKSRNKATGGTGLGLSIARQLVEAHKGEISAHSEDSDGTIITISLPIVTAERGV